MVFARRFRQGMKAAIPVWIAFVPSSIAWGIAAQSHQLTLEEVFLLSAWVYSGPAQFAVLGPLTEGKSALQVLVAGTLMNLRFLPMSTALAPFFKGVRRLPLLLSSHVISASSFIVPYLQFQKERESEVQTVDDESAKGYSNLAFFLGVGVLHLPCGSPARCWVSPSQSVFHPGLKKRLNLFCRVISPGCWSWR